MEKTLGSGVVRFLRRAWRIIRWPLAILAVLYVAGILYQLSQQPKRTAAALEAIRSQKLTMEDVDGRHLPPVPDPKLADATIEGIDANGNGIRDDVELAIFKKYPNNLNLRAAALQYAMTMQLFLTQVHNTETWKAVAEESGRANLCVKESISNPRSGVELTRDLVDLVFNTTERVSARETVSRFTTSYGSASGKSCDISHK